ncbi:MAG: sulfurtransferase [Gammaproteobacteria bacterium]|nr:sulfurtransferase [Gammaproteobacteria bacterium]
MNSNAAGPLKQVAELVAARGREDLVLVDCRFELAAPAAGRLAYLEAHIPGAAYAHLDHDLSGPPSTDHGRHPLPSPERLCALFGALGIDATQQVVAYDDAGGMFAARLWWMLRYMGHGAVTVLDGGWQAWVNAGGATASGDERPPARHFRGAPRRDRLVTLDEVERVAQLVDARAAPRYRGEVEPLDKHPGHIPGAINHCWQSNLGVDGRLADADTLTQRWQASLGALPNAATVHYCGSGVSACHNVLAQVAAGLPEPRLYCGSWSEWCRDSGRPRVIGGESR